MSKITAQLDSQIPEYLGKFSSALREGYSVRQILERHDGLPEPMAGEVKHVANEIQSGVSVADALDHWFTRMPSENLNLFIATLGVQRETGGNLADKLDLLEQIIRKRKPL
jgi:tight adherence protein B